ncbi:MAG: YfiR family protein, partial [Tunicatimonas sp.]
MNVKYSSFFLVICLAFSMEGQAQVPTRKLEAIYMYNFTKYINWQRTGGQGHTIGVWEESEVATELQDNLKNKGNIVVKVISTAAEAKECEIVYLPKTKSAQLSQLMAAAGNDVLIVTEEDLAAKGASVSFVQDGSKL